MLIAKITELKNLPVYDISVLDAEHYVLENGVISHNSGVQLSANTVFIVGRSQEKEGTDVVGWNFTLNVEKSRFVKEKSKLSFLVTYEGGINKWSGLLDLALEYGNVVKPSNGWYSRKDEEQKYRLKDTNTKEFWQPLLADKEFLTWIKQKYTLTAVSFDLLDDDE
jgi:hypothetical protein